MKDPFSVDGKVTVITGGGTGIGAAIAREFAMRGAPVMIAGRTAATLERTRDHIRQAGGRCELSISDVTKPEAVDELVAKAVRNYGRLDVMVNSAGGGIVAPITEMTNEIWRADLAVNLDAYFYGCRAAARQFIAQKSGGAIVNISTSVSFHGWPTLAAYGAAKAGVNNLTLSLSLELAHLGIRVNGVAPGPIRIEKNENFPEYLENMARQQPIGRMGLPEEVAWPVIFFASDASGFITGETILVEGGRGSRSNLLRVGSGRDEGNIVVGPEKGKRG